MSGEYTTAQVAQLAGVAAARVRRFVALGLLEPSRGPRGELRFGFADVALLRAWAKLPGASPARIRRAVDDCRRRGAVDVALGSDGGAIVARDDAGAWEPASGQRLLDWNGRDEVAECAMQVRRLSRSRDELVGTEARTARPEAGGAQPRARDPRRAEEHGSDHGGDDVVALLELGRQRHEAGDAREAARLYERAVAVADAVVAVTAWFNLGVAREDLGDRSGALRAYRAALKLDPSCADAHYNAARLCELAGDQLGALRHLRAYSTCPLR
jgi:tetratricopeptide (TPR) repeat protein